MIDPKTPYAKEIPDPAPRTDFKTDFLRRVKENKPTRWVRFSIVTIIFILWVIWLGNPWVLLLLPLLFDIYITGYIPFTWWKKSTNKVTRAVMSWVDAIVYALILVYFVFTFIGQNYEIPSSSLEKSLLVGDYLWVNKMAYGPRVPQTPLHFPLVQNTFPILNTKSYIEWPQWRYHRLKGLGNVESGDIGLPGETLKIVDGQIYINEVAQTMPTNVQFNYLLQTNRPLTESDWETFGVSRDDAQQSIVNPDPADAANWSNAGFDPAAIVAHPIYHVPLTQAMVDKMRASGLISAIIREPAPQGEFLFPDGISDNWTRQDYGPVMIPKKGQTIKITPENWPMYERVIRNYEYHYDSYLKDGKVYIDGKPADTYTFAMDYYFMMGDNRDCSLDSRYWGFVPEDHIVGKPMRVLVSFDKDKTLFNGGIRWDRVFKNANPGFEE